MIPGLLLTLVVSARAEDPSPARLCADAAEGAEVEVCLRLAATHPEAVDAIAASLRAHIDRQASGDRALLEATLTLLGGDAPAEGARLLGALGDVRAVGPLVHATEAGDVDLAREAVRALTAYSEAVEPLSRWLVDPERPLEVRREAAVALGTLGEAGGADAILAALRRRGLPPPLRQEMIAVIRAQFPERSDELGRAVTSDGRLWLAAGGAWGLGLALGTAGLLVDNDTLGALGIVAGSAAGGSSAWVFASAWPIEAGDAALVTTSGMLATAGGALVGYALGTGDSRRPGALIGALAGELVGTGIALGVLSRYHGVPGDAVEASVFASATGLAAGTLTGFLQQPEPLRVAPHVVRAPSLATGIGFAVGAAVGHAVAPRVRLRGSDAWLMALGIGYGTALGAVVPVGDRRRLMLPMTGLALGYLGSYALAGRVDVDKDTLLGAFLGMGYGAALFQGIGQALDRDGEPLGEPALGSALVGATVGLALGGVFAEKNPHPIDPRDVVLATLVTGWTGWQAVGWGEWAGVSARLRGGYTTLPALAGLSIGLASPLLDVPASSTLSAASLGLWGGYLGAVTGRLAKGDTLLWTLAASDVGLALGVVAASPWLDAPPLVIGTADAGGVLVGALAAAVVGVVAPEADTVLIASLAGAGVGFTGGAILGAWLHQRGGTRDVALRLPRVLPEVQWTVSPWTEVRGEGTVTGLRVGGVW